MASCASLKVATLAGSPTTEILPVAFGPHRGALHRPAGQRARALAVVICPPIGRDARCAYRRGLPPDFTGWSQAGGPGFRCAMDGPRARG